ncbi:hypothetical protein EVJ50_03940 [Synechococcus sp. RSCCF101]|nr:hypothetical protein EVJ50_03940 [Synechococcus sp. RSCCF101]
MTGSEPLAGGTLLDFWRWSGGNLLDNTQRGLLAEFLVTKALGGAHSAREEWAAVDVVCPDGTKVEVKSSAFLQSWPQRQPSRPSFGIAPTRAWDSATGKYEAVTKRQADVYVFALLAHKTFATVVPTDLSQWEFYVVRTGDLPQQKTIGLRPLQAIAGAPVAYENLAEAVRKAAMRADPEGSTDPLPSDR